MVQQGLQQGGPRLLLQPVGNQGDITEGWKRNIDSGPHSQQNRVDEVNACRMLRILEIGVQVCRLPLSLPPLSVTRRSVREGYGIQVRALTDKGNLVLTMSPRANITAGV